MTDKKYIDYLQDRLEAKIKTLVERQKQISAKEKELNHWKAKCKELEHWKAKYDEAHETIKKMRGDALGIVKDVQKQLYEENALDKELEPKASDV
ncbi:MAG: hypothetical protein FWG63_02980 [Defluviitaleaceae bacterium]|nr:hypothetical protein [Defluviitaleaceae bacterium]